MTPGARRCARSSLCGRVSRGGLDTYPIPNTNPNANPSRNPNIRFSPNPNPNPNPNPSLMSITPPDTVEAGTCPSLHAASLSTYCAPSLPAAAQIPRLYVLLPQRCHTHRTPLRRLAATEQLNVTVTLTLSQSIKCKGLTVTLTLGESRASQRPQTVCCHSCHRLCGSPRTMVSPEPKPNPNPNPNPNHNPNPNPNPNPNQYHGNPRRSPLTVCLDSQP